MYIICCVYFALCFHVSVYACIRVFLSVYARVCTCVLDFCNFIFTFIFLNYFPLMRDGV